MPSKSKNKGSSYEREVANFLSAAYGESFIRAPGSGAYVGGKNQVAFGDTLEDYLVALLKEISSQDKVSLNSMRKQNLMQIFHSIKSYQVHANNLIVG